MVHSRKPWLSAIVPCWGQLHHLRISAPPLLADESVEFILVDHHCPDKCSKIARAYWPAAKAVEVLDAERFNRGHAFNRGVGAASGEWLAFLDPSLAVSEGFARVVRPLLAEDVLLESPPFDPVTSTAGDGGPGLLMCSAAAFSHAGGFDPPRLAARFC